MKATIISALVIVVLGCTTPRVETVVKTVEVVEPVYRIPPALKAIQPPARPNLAIEQLNKKSLNREILQASYLSIIQLMHYSESLEDVIKEVQVILHTESD